MARAIARQRVFLPVPVIGLARENDYGLRTLQHRAVEHKQADGHEQVENDVEAGGVGQSILPMQAIDFPTSSR